MLKIILITFSIFLQSAQSSLAEPIIPKRNEAVKPRGIVSLESLKRIPVLENGRIKPLDTYARNILLQLSGRSSFERKTAAQWLARLLFDPQSTQGEKIFLINNPAIPEALGIEPNEKRRYSLSQLEPVLERLFDLASSAKQIEQKQRDVVENELIRVAENIRLYLDLSGSLAFGVPHPDFIITHPETLKKLNLPEDQHRLSFLDLALKAETLQELTQPLEATPADQWTDAQREVGAVVGHLFHWSMNYRQLPFAVIPSYLPDDDAWYSPWDAMNAALQIPEGRRELSLLEGMMISYGNGQQIDFDLAVKAFADSTEERIAKKDQTILRRLDWEILFNRLHLFFWAKIFYFAAFFLFLISLVKVKPFLRSIAFTLILFGFILQLLAIILRIMILQRPPVSNLYETFIFVSCVCVFIGMMIEWFQKQWLGIVTSSLCGFIFLTIASKFSMEGDTLQMLVAVLNSNFWLGTHVLSITTGYAGTCVAGILGHIYILQCIFKSRNRELLESTQKILVGSLAFALIATFLGTNLGGIWADQSWGRFWGWDPKENGALLIILWLAILLHAKAGKMIGPFGLAVGSALAIIIVMWAWFGVNLLNVGLHSYGFTSGLATNLAIYFICQILFMAVTVPIAKKKCEKVKS